LKKEFSPTPSLFSEDEHKDGVDRGQACHSWTSFVLSLIQTLEINKEAVDEDGNKNQQMWE